MSFLFECGLSPRFRVFIKFRHKLFMITLSWVLLENIQVQLEPWKNALARDIGRARAMQLLLVWIRLRLEGVQGSWTFGLLGDWRLKRLLRLRRGGLGLLELGEIEWWDHWRIRNATLRFLNSEWVPQRRFALLALMLVALRTHLIIQLWMTTLSQK